MTKGRSALRKLAPIYEPTLHVTKVQRHKARLQVTNCLYWAGPSFLTSSCTGNCCVWFCPFMIIWSRIKTKQNQNAKQEKEVRTPVFSPKYTRTERGQHWLLPLKHTSLAVTLFNICQSQVWNSREACGQMSQYPGFYKSFSPTYYSSSFCYSPAPFQKSISYRLFICYENGSFHSFTHTMYQHENHLYLHLPELISLFCRGFKIRCTLHLQLACKKTPKSRQISHLLHFTQKPRQLLQNLQFASVYTAT